MRAHTMRRWQCSPVAASRQRPAACRAIGKQHHSSKEIDQLLALVSGTERGVKSTAVTQEQILQLVGRIAAASPGAETTGPALSATWKLLWTTEKETLFILERAGLFGTQAGEVYQVIDTAAQSLQNVITFPPQGAFIVDSRIAPGGPRRTQFAFTGAKLKLPARDVGLPPFGKGWFDTVYLDERLRISQDSRGDTLVVARDGPPRRFQ